VLLQPHSSQTVIISQLRTLSYRSTASKLRLFQRVLLYIYHLVSTILLIKSIHPVIKMIPLKQIKPFKVDQESYPSLVFRMLHFQS
jgi:hypothetical protein